MKELRNWRLIYAVCCLLYIGWMIRVGAFEFDRINGQYRRIAEQLDSGRIRSSALEELIRECRRQSPGLSGPEQQACLSLPPPMVEARAKKIEDLLLRAKKRAVVKIVLFYTVFLGFFLLAPTSLVYLIIIGIIRIFREIKIVR